jgi:threonine dehydrogenase-like Zn-dependent dehydrogenase
VVELFSSGALDPRPLITHRYPLEGYEAAFGALQDPAAAALKVQLLP